MKRTLYGLLTFLLCFILGKDVSAKPIDSRTAMLVAEHFLKTRTTSQIFRQSFQLELIYTYADKASSVKDAPGEGAYFYVFNMGKQGFIAVSADDVVLPVLAYSDESAFDPNGNNTSVLKWFQGYADQIRYAVLNGLEANDEINKEWEELLLGTKSASLRRGSVSPLITTKWDQSPYFNDLCPFDRTYNERAVTGCVATAMAQVIKYWNYPDAGTGFNSYNHTKYGTISSNFADHVYNYSNMPNYVTSANTDVAQLMFDCGVSVNMDYGVDGSSATTIGSGITAESALKKYFGYSSSLSGKFRSAYTDATWLSMVKSELDAGVPLLYRGVGGGGGHCFVADGYDNNNYVHFNWGWGGSSDGYFQLNALNPGSTGTGGGTGGFNSSQGAIFGIKGATGNLNYKLTLNTSINVSPSTISYGGAFTVSANFTNNSTYAFKGDYCAAVFDDRSNFVDFVEIKTGYTLQAGYKYTNDLVFSTTGNLKMLPGKYTISIYYRPDGGDWQVVNGTLFYLKSKPITVTNNKNIALYSDMLPSDLAFTKGEPASVSLNIVNKSGSTFKGRYAVSLFNLDGTWAQTLKIITESNGLPDGYVYTSNLVFSSDSITVSPGTYLLAMQHIPDGASTWILTGSNNYQNPIMIDVMAPPLKADIYEANDNASLAYNLNLNFSGNQAKPATPGSNIHVETDYDYYKIALPTGYNYSLTPRLHDEYNSGNSYTYTLDAVFSYSLDGGITWSDAFDDLVPAAIDLPGGKSILFKVAPYFVGMTGTYLLEIPVSRTSTANVATPGISPIRAFPNPTKDLLKLDAGTLIIDRLELLDVNGKVMLQQESNLPGQSISLKHLSPGIYWMRIQSGEQVFVQKVIKD